MNVNGSVTPVVFRATVPRNGGRPFILRRLTWAVYDTVANPPNWAVGGDPATTQLTNGLLINFVRADGTRFPLVPQPVKNSADLMLTAGASFLQVPPLARSETDSTLISWDMSVQGFEVILREGDSVEITVQDNLTSLAQHRASIMGYWRTK